MQWGLKRCWKEPESVYSIFRPPNAPPTPCGDNLFFEKHIFTLKRTQNRNKSSGLYNNSKSLNYPFKAKNCSDFRAVMRQNRLIFARRNIEPCNESSIQRSVIWCIKSCCSTNCSASHYMCPKGPHNLKLWTLGTNINSWKTKMGRGWKKMSGALAFPESPAKRVCFVMGELYHERWAPLVQYLDCMPWFLPQLSHGGTRNI